MIPSETAAIFFDAVGTLIHPRPDAAAVYAAVGQRFGSRHTAAEIARRFRTAFRTREEEDRRDGWRTNEERELRRWREIVPEVLDDVTDPDCCFAALYEHFRRPESWECAADAETVLHELARRGYVLGLASNFDERLRHVAEGLPALRPVRHFVISAEVGWRKPAPAFFAAIRKETGLAPECILFIGDDPENDFDGARAAGMRALLFDPHNRHPERPCLVGLAELL
jgi:putative hydrolase of the HAD superfamily